MRIEEFAGTRPELKPELYFAGKTRAWGIFEDRFGTLRRDFTVEIDGVWDGATLTLTEDFQYGDGAREQRVWRITRTGDGNYEGRADDVIGVARGRTCGKALNWSYGLILRIGQSDVTVRFDDWMFLQPGGVLINKAAVSKFGFSIGTVTLFFRKEGEDAETLSAGSEEAA